MKILHINYSKERGGAAKACLRLHKLDSILRIYKNRYYCCFIYTV